MPCTALNFVFATLVGMSAVLHSQDSRGPARQDGVYLVPMSVSDERIAELQRYYRKELRLDVKVLPSFSPALASWNAERRQWSAEAVLDALIEREEARLRGGRVVVIAITDDDIASRRDGWVFESTDALRRVKVTCHIAGRTASTTEDISLGANEVAIVERVRRACDVIAAKTEQ